VGGVVGVGDPGGGVGVRVSVGHGVFEGVRVKVGGGEGVDVIDGVNVLVADEVVVGVEVTGAPVTVNVPTCFQSSPKNNWTVYNPGSHSSGSGFHSVKPEPPVPPSHGSVSKLTNSLFLNHKAVHCTPSVIPS
jgi:hypothetical protein